MVLRPEKVRGDSTAAAGSGEDLPLQQEPRQYGSVTRAGRGFDGSSAALPRSAPQQTRTDKFSITCGTWIALAS